jgi:ribonuclease BN (tRNA processing enzyme)
MKLVVLGSGTAVPHPKRSSAAFWLETSGGTVLLDCSASVPHRMAQESLDWAGLDAIWVSHFHVDHCGGIAPYLFGMRWAAREADRKKPLRIFGAAGLKDLLSKLNDASGGKILDQPFTLETVEVEPLEEFDLLDGVKAVAMSTPHTPESCAVRVTYPGGASIVYTSDTGFAKEISAFAKEADLLVIESSFVKDKPVEKHLELAEAMYLIRHARPKRAMLTHLYAEWDDVDFDAEVRRFEPACEVIQAFDGIRLDVSEIVDSE